MQNKETVLHCESLVFVDIYMNKMVVLSTTRSHHLVSKYCRMCFSESNCDGLPYFFRVDFGSIRLRKTLELEPSVGREEEKKKKRKKKNQKTGQVCSVKRPLNRAWLVFGHKKIDRGDLWL